MNLTRFNNLRFEYSVGANVIMFSLVDISNDKSVLTSANVSCLYIEYSYGGTTSNYSKNLSFHINSLLGIITDLPDDTDITITPYIIKYNTSGDISYKIRLTDPIEEHTLPYGNIDYNVIEDNGTVVRDKIIEIVGYINRLGAYVEDDCSDTTLKNHLAHAKTIPIKYKSTIQTADAVYYQGYSSDGFIYGLVRTSGGPYANNNTFFHELRHRYGITSPNYSHITRDKSENRSDLYSYIEDKFTAIHNAMKFETGKEDSKVWVFGAHSNIPEGRYTDTGNYNYLAANYLKALIWYTCHTPEEEDNSKIRIIPNLNLVEITGDEPEPEVEYNIISNCEHGIVSLSHTKAIAGEIITLYNFTPNEGYELLSVSITADNGEDITVYEDTSDGYKLTFTMPASNVSIIVRFKEIGSEIPDDAPEYNINLSTNNGTAELTKTKAKEGEEVRVFNIIPDPGYKLSSIKILYNDTYMSGIFSGEGDERVLKFIMPGYDCIVEVLFIEEDESENTDNKFYLSTLIKPYFIDKDTKVYLLSNEYNNDFINKSLNITLYPYEDIVNNIYNINHSINSTSTVLNDDRYYFNLVSKLGFVDGNISLINNFIFPGKIEEKDHYSSIEEAEAYEAIINSQIRKYYNTYYINETLENYERESYLDEIDIEEIRSTGFYIQFANDVNFKEIVYESKINIDSENDNFIYDFSFSLNNLFESWDQLNEILVIRTTFIDKRLGIFIRGNNVVLTKEWFKYLINDSIDGQVIYSKQNNLITQKFMDVNQGFNLIHDINCVIVDKETVNSSGQIQETNVNTKIVYKPIFYKVQDLQNIRLHQGVTQNIGINLGGFLTKVDTFILNINGKNYKESARNDVFVIFKINANNIEENSGYYNILDQNFDYISSGNYTLY